MKIKEFIRKISENRLIFDIICIFCVAIFISIPLMKKNIDIFLDDGSQHLMRAYGTYQSIKQNGTGTIILDFANGFGYSWNLFYGPLSTYLVIFISLLFHSFNIGFKIVLGLIILFAGLFMHKFIKAITDNDDSALLASIIYMCSPYLFNDIYIRHSIGEVFAFVFIPLVFLGLYNLLNSEDKHYYLIFGASGLILSHNISTVFVAIIAVFYCLINFKSLFSTRVKKGLLIDISFILLLTSFYWLPFWECKFFTNYQVFEKDAMSTKDNFLNYCLKIKELFITGKNQPFLFEIGLPMILMMVFSRMTIQKIEVNKKEYMFFLIVGFASLWMSTKYFPWKILPDCFSVIQFSWRLLVISSFCIAVCCSFNMFTLIKNFNIKDVIILTVICLIYVVSRFYLIPFNNEIKNIEDYDIPNLSGHNNEWIVGMGRLEYLPTKSYKNSFFVATRDKEINVIDGKCDIALKKKEGFYLKAKVLTTSQKVKLELPYINYPGYTVRFDGIIQKTYETENGFLGCTIDDNENGILEVEFTGTNIMKISQMISMGSFVIYIIYVWKKH